LSTPYFVFQGGGAQSPGNPEEHFKKEYEEYFAKNPDKALPQKALEDAVKKYLDSKRGKGKSEKEMLEEAYAREHGVSLEDMKAYQKFWEQIEALENPETNESVVAGIREIFRKIITERIKPLPRSKQPVSEGDLLVRPAEAVVAISTGEMEPAIWETREKKEKKEKKAGNFDVTLVVDRSDSMKESDENGAVKYVEQKKAAILTLEALREFSEELDEIRMDLEDDLQVRTEAWSFGGQAEVGILKPLGDELTEAQRVAVFKTLNSVPGDSTLDYLALQRLEKMIPQEDLEKIKRGDLRKIVIVMTDGDSSNSDELKKVISSLREKGVIVAAVGITKAGAAAEVNYAPDGRLCERADNLALTLGGLLQEYLKEL